MNTGWDKPKHLLRNVQSPNVRARVLVVQNPCEAPFTAPDVQHLFIGQVAEELYEDLNVLNAGVDGRREMFFVFGRFVEPALYFGAKIGMECGADGRLCEAA
jgi:hypothetical protein